MRIVLRTTTAALLVVVASAAATAAPAKKPAEAAPAKGGEAAAAAKAGGSGKPAGAVPLLPGSSSKEPVNITADKLDFLNKDNKLVYTGNVVVVQGDTTMKASVLHIDLQKTDPAAGGATAPAGAPAGGDVGPGQGSSVRHMEADGPVTLISKDQIGTGDHATYDKGEDKVYLNGNVTLSQGPNVTQGDHLVYDMTSGQAQVFSGQTNGGRVTSVFTPGSSSPAGDTAKPVKPEPKKPEPKKGSRRPVAARGTPKGEAAAD